MAHNLAYLERQVPPGSRAAGVAISRARWHYEGDSHWSQRTPAIFFIVTERPVRLRRSHPPFGTGPAQPGAAVARPPGLSRREPIGMVQTTSVLNLGNQDSDLPAGKLGVPDVVDPDGGRC